MKSLFVTLVVLISIVLCDQTYGEFLATGHVDVDWCIGVSDKLIVWGGDEEGLYGYDRILQTDFIISRYGRIGELDVSGDTLVFIEGSNIYGYSHDTQTKFLISTASDTCAIDGKMVVYSDQNKIYLYDIESEEKVELADVSVFEAKVAISGNVVAWADGENLYCYYIDSKVMELKLVLSSRILCVDMDGDIVAMRTSKSVFICNIENGPIVEILSASSHDMNVSVSRSIVVWDSLNNIYGLDYDTKPISTFLTIADSPFAQGAAEICGNLVIWRGDHGWGYNPIFGAYLDSGNDECGRATEVVKGVALSGSTAEATGLDVTTGSYNDHKDVWHYFEPAVSGSYTVSLCGSGFDTTVGVFGDCNGQEVAFNDDHCGVQSQVSFKAKAGVRYLIRVAGYDGDSGEYTVMVTGGAACINRPVADISGDCKVDMADLAMVAAEWLSCGLDDESACWD